MADTVVERILGAGNHFEVFDIPPVGVDVGTITKLYRRLALKVHPDKCRHADGPEAFRRLTAAHDILGDPREQKTYLNEYADLARVAAASRFQKERAQKAAAAARKAAAEASMKAAREAEERALREAAKADKKKERELRKQQAEAKAAREAVEQAAAEEVARKEEAAAREEGRRKAKSLQQARRRLRNTRSALQTAADEAAAAAAGEAEGEGTDASANSLAPSGLLTEEEVELLCARLSEAELERVLVALLVGDTEAAAAAAASVVAQAAAEAAEAAAAAETAAAARRITEAEASAARAEASVWSEREQTALVKAAKQQGLTFVRVGGHANWDSIASFVSTSSESPHPWTGDGCRAEFRRLANEFRRNGSGVSSSGLPKPPLPAPPSRAAEAKGPPPGSPPKNEKTPHVKAAAAASSAPPEVEGVWSVAQQKALEAAMVAHPAGNSDPSARWRAIGKTVDGKTAKECLARYKSIRAAVKARHDSSSSSASSAR
jgi:curved DNA-binding protein CbpA